MDSLKNKTLINFCPTGMVPTKSMTPYVPISPSEIIEQTHEAYEVGITIAHLHARGEDGVPTHKSVVYRDIIEGVRKHCPGLVVCASTSGRNVKEFEKRSEVIELQPDMCSLTLSSLNFMKSASVNAPDMIKQLFQKMIDYGVHAELECFDLGMVSYGNYLLKKNNINTPCYWNLLFGNIAGWQPTFVQIAAALEAIPKSHHIALGGLGQFQTSTIGMALANNLGVRVGIEDNIWYDHKRTELAKNINLVKRVHQLMEIHGKELMKSEDVKLYNTKREVNV